MGIETERKFLVSGDAWRSLADPVPYAQGYLASGSGVTVRIRIAANHAFITVKGPVEGISRAEFEYIVPVNDAREMLRLCPSPIIEKTRRSIPHGSHVWEIDEFGGENLGLVIAEVELSSPDEAVSIPPWIGAEVTGDPRYYNSNLAVYPYREWKG
jgi:CYTH domain-containing protein